MCYVKLATEEELRISVTIVDPFMLRNWRSTISRIKTAERYNIRPVERKQKRQINHYYQILKETTCF